MTESTFRVLFLFVANAIRMAEFQVSILAELTEHDLALAEKLMAVTIVAGMAEARAAGIVAYEKVACRLRQTIELEANLARLTPTEPPKARAEPAHPRDGKPRAAAPRSYPPGSGRTLHDWRNSN